MKNFQSPIIKGFRNSNFEDSLIYINSIPTIANFNNNSINNFT